MIKTLCVVIRTYVKVLAIIILDDTSHTQKGDHDE